MDVFAGAMPIRGHLSIQHPACDARRWRGASFLGEQLLAVSPAVFRPAAFGAFLGERALHGGGPWGIERETVRLGTARAFRAFFARHGRHQRLRDTRPAEPGMVVQNSAGTGGRVATSYATLPPRA